MPHHVADAEELARCCNIGHGRPGNVKAEAFFSTRHPLEMSVDRTRYTDPWLRVDDRKKRTLVFLTALAARRVGSFVLARKPPIAHCELHDAESIGVRRLVTEKTALSPGEWKAHVILCTALAGASRGDPSAAPKPPPPKPASKKKPKPDPD